MENTIMFARKTSVNKKFSNKYFKWNSLGF